VGLLTALLSPGRINAVPESFDHVDDFPPELHYCSCCASVPLCAKTTARL
jgi:hypothetical protein